MDENQENRPFNYLYFGALFVLLLITSTCSILLKEDLAHARFFFWFYAVGQAVLEVAAFIFLGSIIHRYLGKVGFALFVGFTFVCFSLHLIDFILDRILDLSVWGGVKAFILGESLDGFILLLDATSISLSTWIIVFSLLTTIPIFGLIFYKGTDWLISRAPLSLKKETFLQIFVCVPAALLFWDYTVSDIIHPDSYTQFTKSLPWKRTFFLPETVSLPFNKSLRSPPNEEQIEKAIGELDLKLTKKPNIFLIVTETLRADFITPEVAPHLYQFGKEHVSGVTSLSNANWTSISWFSIFHSQFPFYWAHLQKNGWKSGSPALQLFKKLGYQTRVYTSTQLAFYGLEKLIFGENKQLLDSLHAFYHTKPKEAFSSDIEVMEALQKDMADPSLQEGQFFIVFLDGTHFDYSFPKPAHFQPAASGIDFFHTYPTAENIERIKNRYRNAVHQIDTLFGQFISSVDPHAIIAFTGDHGEEFYDHGHLFHGSHLSQEQVSVPIYFKIGEHQAKVKLLSQMDIMPTLLDAVSYQTFPFLEGESALRTKEWPYVAVARFNARQTPYEFSLFNEKNRCIAQFNNSTHVFEATGVNILSLRTCQEGLPCNCCGGVQEWVQSEFGPALNRFFSE